MNTTLPKVSQTQYARLTEAQIARTNELTKREQIRNRKIAGELIERSAVEREWFTISRQVRDALQNIPARCAGPCASMKTQDEVFQLLTKEVDQALEGFATKGRKRP